MAASPKPREVRCGVFSKMPLAQIRPYLDEAVRLGVREYYFTGGEPFLNPEMEAILAATLLVGPATVLTNGLLLDRERCARLKRLARMSMPPDPSSVATFWDWPRAPSVSIAG